MEIKKRLKNLIAENKIEEALKLLIDQSSEGREGLEDIAISLSNRYRRFKDKSLKGLESREQELSQIIHDTLEVVNSMDTPDHLAVKTSAHSSAKAVSATPIAPANQKTAKNKLVIGGVVLLILAMLAWIIIPGDPDMEEQLPAEENATNLMTTPTDEPTYTAETPPPNVNAPSLEGQWRQVGQNMGPDNECPDCTIHITQSNWDRIDISASNGWSASMLYNKAENDFAGTIDWAGLFGPDISTTEGYMYMENEKLVFETEINGQEYLIEYQN